ncbi:hypothetical protein NCCP2716_29130 [Sporosarcina sp. NCCP-2716]|uniref:hypothetical protein n=1 Tax=Sporosarcina sp. NCCP-2716 TaxID=2943679 RepID=UPI00203FDC1C|nr:hypothetical protein [Sporosarcina sp. NCCP-2716]GKV70415.1 hypothetical protein NCCP2716_29130 [Sporosarcina sp. NCCP-2716]
MKSSFYKKVSGLLLISSLTLGLSNGVLAEELDSEPTVAVAKNNSLPSLLPKHGTEGMVETYAADARSIKTDTGGTLTSNTWLSSIHSNGLIDYQVSANYNKTDHQNIKTQWFATIESNSTSKTASVTISTSGGSVSASTTKTTTTAKTASKYYQNTKSQKDASYKSNLAVQGDWRKVTLTNEASVWGNKVVKKAAINSQATVTK